MQSVDVYMSVDWLKYPVIMCVADGGEYDTYVVSDINKT